MQKETESMKVNLTIENVNNQQTPIMPNNQVCGASVLPPRTPIPPESLKCNILKAKSLELGKNSNLVSISTAEATPSPEKTQHSDAATIVSVVSFQLNLECIVFYGRVVLFYFHFSLINSSLFIFQQHTLKLQQLTHYLITYFFLKSNFFKYILFIHHSMPVNLIVLMSVLSP